MSGSIRHLLAPLLLSVLSVLSVLAGCLDFDEEEVHVAYDAEHDRLDAQLVYRGLYSAGTSDWSWFGTPPVREDVEGTEKQLDQILDGRPIFALFDPILMCDLVELRESDDAQVAAFAKLAAVDRGDLFRSEDGRICGWQHLRIRNVTRAVELWDEMWRAKLADAKYAKEWRTTVGCDDPDSVKLCNDAIEKPRRWFERSGGELLFHLPASAKAARALAARVEAAPPLESLLNEASSQDVDDDAATSAAPVRPADPADPAKADVRRDPELRRSDATGFAVVLHAFGVTVRPRDGGADLVLWDAARTPQTLHVRKPTRKEKHYDLAPYLEKRKVVLRTDVTDEILKSDFAERCKH